MTSVEAGAFECPEISQELQCMHSSFCRAVSGYNYEIINLKYHVQYQSLLNSLFDRHPALEAYTREIFAVLVL